MSFVHRNIPFFIYKYQQSAYPLFQGFFLYECLWTFIFIIYHVLCIVFCYPCLCRFPYFCSKKRQYFKGKKVKR